MLDAGAFRRSLSARQGNLTATRDHHRHSTSIQATLSPVYSRMGVQCRFTPDVQPLRARRRAVAIAHRVADGWRRARPPLRAVDAESGNRGIHRRY